MSQTIECSHCGLKFNIESASVTTSGKVCPRCGWLLKTDNVAERHKESMGMSAADGKSELKPCPFCGSTDVHLIENGHNKSDVSITCKDCNVWVDHTFDAMSKEEAIELWNKRVKE